MVKLSWRYQNLVEIRANRKVSCWCKTTKCKKSKKIFVIKKNEILWFLVIIYVDFAGQCKPLLDNFISPLKCLLLLCLCFVPNMILLFLVNHFAINYARKNHINWSSKTLKNRTIINCYIKKNKHKNYFFHHKSFK